jgi:hypothetical protein
LHATDRTLKFLKADIMGKEGGMVHTKAYVEPLVVDQLVAGQAWLARASSFFDGTRFDESAMSNIECFEYGVFARWVTDGDLG